MFFVFEDVNVNVYRDCDAIAWFLAQDVLTSLGMSVRNASKFLDRHVSAEFKRQFSFGVGRPSWYVAEPGIYQLVFQSKSEKAYSFQHWVFREVLPAIRRDGVYVSPDITPEQTERLASRIMGTPRKAHPLFGDENMNRIASFLKCSRNSIKLANWMWNFIYENLTSEERADLNQKNPIQSNGHRKQTIHAWLEENTMHQHKSHFDAILLLVELSQTEEEFCELYQRKFKRQFQLQLF